VALHVGRSRLPELLKKVGKTQAGLADHLDVSESYISQVIKGTSKLSVIKMKMTADFLGCHMDDLNEWIYTEGKR
jgi:transcriptional regulator with XRE-family HTH domain